MQFKCNSLAGVSFIRGPASLKPTNKGGTLKKGASVVSQDGGFGAYCFPETSPKGFLASPFSSDVPVGWSARVRVSWLQPR